MPFSVIAPLIRGDDWWDTYDYPARIFDQCFGVALADSDLLDRSFFHGHWLRLRSHANIAASGQSEVKNDDNEFKVVLNVSQFKPEELQVKVAGNFVVVHGKHEERTDDHGLVSRAFTRRYMLPKLCEMENVSSLLSSEGMLTVFAPKKAIEPAPKEEREVPIAQETKESVKESAECK